jgi:hypothetical protein
MSISPRHFGRATLFLLLLLLLAGLGATPARAQDPPAELSLPDLSGFVSERLRIALDIAGADSMQAGTIDLEFDPDVVTPLPLTLVPGSFGQSLPGIWGASIQAAGVFRIAFSTADVTGFVGSGTLCTFDVDLIAVGASPLAFRSILLERTPNIQLPATGRNGSITAAPLAVDATTWGRVKGQFGILP